MGSKLEVDLHALETRLLDPDVRASASKLDEFLADDFMEFGSSGHVYDKSSMIETSAPGTGIRMGGANHLRVRSSRARVDNRARHIPG
jgi:hypothetical protein